MIGATVTVTGGGTVRTGTTADPGGTGNACCLFGITAAGTYAVTVSATGYQTWSGSLSLACGGTYTIAVQPTTASPTIQFTVTGCCGGAPVAGALVTLSDGQTCTTNSSGQCNFWVGTGATLTYTIAKSRWQTVTGNVTVGSCVTSTTNVPVTLSPASGYVCGLYYGSNTGAGSPLADPIPTTLHLTDSVYGAVVLTYNATTQIWTGSQTVATATACGCPANHITLTYTMHSCGSNTVLNVTGTVCAGSCSIPNRCPCIDPTCSWTSSTNCSQSFGFSTSGPSFSVASSVPYSFTGTIAGSVCGSGYCFEVVYASGVTITITE